MKPISVTPMQSTDVDAIPEYEYLGEDFVGEMPAQHYLNHAKDPKVIAAVKAWLANKQEKLASSLNPWHRQVQHFIDQGYTPIAAPDGNVTFKKGDKYYSWSHDAIGGPLSEVSPADAAADLEYSGPWNEPELTATPSQDEVYHQFVKDMGEGYGDQLHHVSGGLPDVRGLSDVDVGYVSPEYSRLMDKLPKGTTAEHKDQRSIYNIPGYGRKIGLYATDNPDFIERSRDHRDVANSLAKQHPELVSAASKLKQDGMGTEPAWAQTLGMEGDPYEAMRNRSLIKLSATLKQLGNFNSY